MVKTDLPGILEIRSGSKHFLSQDDDVIEVLSDIDLEIQAGEFVSLIGPSGCGKSTLLYCLAGLMPLDSGTIQMDGRQITDTTPEIGLVFQNPQLFDWLTIEKNIAFGLKARGVYREQREDVVRYIDLIGLRGFERSYPHQISGGMAQRVNLARTLINRPKVLLLDEPFGALDSFTRRDMQRQLKAIWESHRMTMVMVTHDIDEAIYMSQRIVVFSPRPSRIRQIIPNTCHSQSDSDAEDFRAMRQRILEAMEF